MKRLVTLPILVGLILYSGCGTPESIKPDPLSAGSAKRLLEVNKTTQLEVVEAFGGPNIVTGGPGGQETWTYDRVSYETWSRAMGLLGGGGAGSGPGGGGLGFWANSSRSIASSRSMTLTMYFKNDVLVDYKYRATMF